MKNLGLGLALLAGIALVGCGDDGGRTGDGGTDDDGGIILMDSGPGSDGGGGTDSGGGGTDSGGGGTDCMLTNSGLSGSDCFPRCSADTASTVSGCGDGMCVQDALESDATPSISIADGMGGSFEVDCAACYNVQVNTCIAESCPEEFQALVECSGGGGDCSTEEMALDECISTNMSTIQSCAQGRAGMCFPT